MHYDNIKNIKSRYETLYDAELKDDVWNTENDRYIELEKY